MTPAGPGWWTDSDERSTLVIELTPAVHTLQAEIYVTHFVNKLVFEADGLVLDHSFQATEDSNCYIRVDLRPLSQQQRRRAILTLRLARESDLQYRLTTRPWRCAAFNSSDGNRPAMICFSQARRMISRPNLTLDAAVVAEIRAVPLSTGAYP